MQDASKESPLQSHGAHGHIRETEGRASAKIVIVTGSTTWSDADLIRRELAKLPPASTVVFGDCSGADELAGKVAKELGHEPLLMEKEPQDYDRHGRELAWKGLNERMLARGAWLVLAFHHNFDQSTGTKHMVEIARTAGVAVKINGVHYEERGHV